MVKSLSHIIKISMMVRTEGRKCDIMQNDGRLHGKMPTQPGTQKYDFIKIYYVIPLGPPIRSSAPIRLFS